jgi:hypothetical protein
LLSLLLRADAGLAVIEHAGELIKGQLLMVIDGFGRVRLGEVSTVRHSLVEFCAAEKQFTPHPGMRHFARFGNT